MAALVALAVVLLAFGAARASAAPAFVQVATKEVKTGTVNGVAFPAAVKAGSTIVVYTAWSNTGTATVADNRGNAYAPVGAAQAWGGSWRGPAFVAKNVAAGAATVTVTYGTAITSFGIVYAHEYSGLDPTNPVDVNRSASGTGKSITSGALATTNANDLLFTGIASDGTTSTAANPTHTYAAAGTYTARLSVSDGTNTTLSAPVTIAAGSPPVVQLTAPTDNATFRAGDTIQFAADATDPDDGPLPASAFTWSIDFLHEGHVHPGVPQTGVKSGSFPIPTTGHDFSGFTRYRVCVAVKDATNLTTTKCATVFPEKVTLSVDTVPSGLTVNLDGIAKVTPFGDDDLIGFQHELAAPAQTFAGRQYAFDSWSDGGAATHTITVPATNASFTARFTSTAAAPPAFVQQANATPQSPQTTVTVPFPAAQGAGNLNVVVVGFDNRTSTISSVTDSAGNAYAVAAPLTRSAANSQAI